MRSGTGAEAVDPETDALYEDDNDDDYEDDDEDEDEDEDDDEGSGPGGPPPGGGAVDVVEGGIPRDPVLRAGVTGRPRRTVGGGVGR